MSSKRKASELKPAKKTAKNNPSEMEGAAKKPSARTRNQQEVADVEMTKDLREPDLEPITDIFPKEKPKASQQSQIAQDDVSLDGSSANSEMILPKDKPEEPEAEMPQTSNAGANPSVLTEPTQNIPKRRLSNSGEGSQEEKVNTEGTSEPVSTNEKPNKEAQQPQTSKSDGSTGDFKREGPTEDVESVTSDGNPAEPLETAVLQLKIQLRHIRPPIWRRIQVLNDDTFDLLSKYIIQAMGWKNTHLHHFVIPDPKRRNCRLIVDGNIDGASDDLSEGDLIEQTTKLSMILKAKGDRVDYEYDFGDSWLHSVVVEKVLPVWLSDAVYPNCVGGRRACPPEDCGGSDGYEQLLEVYRNPNHSDYQDMIVEWLLKRYPGWNPEEFNKDGVF